MAIKTANVLARVEPSVKAKAEEILEKLGIPVSTAINMLYKQIIITQSLPFKLSLNTRPKARDEITDEEFNSMLKLSLKQAKENKGYDLDEAFDLIEKWLKQNKNKNRRLLNILFISFIMLYLFIHNSFSWGAHRGKITIIWIRY